jgi:hypothetical protein
LIIINNLKYFILNNTAMKRFLIITVIGFLSVAFIATMQSCRKKPTIPALTTANVSDITQISAVSGGDITNDGGAEVTVRGVCWGTSHNSTTVSSKTNDGKGSGAFTSNITGLTADTKYYVRAYAINSEGTGYGNEVTFTSSQIKLATLTTTEVSSVTLSSAVSGGNIISDGGGNIISRGVCWKTGLNPTTADNKTDDGTGTGSFASNITNLQAGTNYHVRAYAINSGGTAYGNELTFTTSGQLPSATTQDATNVTNTSSTLNGIVNANYLSTAVIFEFGLTPGYGQTAAVQTMVTGNTNTLVDAEIAGLLTDTTYHFRIKATNALGTTYGNDMTFYTGTRKIGDSFGGGIIFYIDNTGQHGLICAKTDQSTGIQWYNGSYIITNATETSVGKGQSNTTKIVTVQQAGNYAAKICDDLVLNGYSDWFLPSKDELDLMYKNLKAKGHGGFSDSVYWSSTEYNTNNAFYQTFDNGYQDNTAKSILKYVRAVRAF